MSPRKRSTKFINVNTRKCKACWACLDECKFGVLGKVNFWFHKHVVIKNGDECHGCKKCIAICPHGVFEPITQSET